MNILIVEDEPKLAQLLADYLSQAGFESHIIADGQQALEYLNAKRTSDLPDLMILDLMLPSLDGMEICKAVRQFSHLPIIMATAKVEEIDRLLGLELGADDYICKPYSPKEVVARVKTILRRVQWQEVQKQDSQAEQSALAALSGLTLEPSQLKAVLQGHTLELTSVEFQLLELMASQPGRIFNRQQLMDKCYQDHRVVSDRTIDSHIKKLRKRIKDKCPEQELIHSVYGVGYKFEVLAD